MPKKSYIIHVYTQPEFSEFEFQAEDMVGTVEDVDVGVKHAFHNKSELWKFMTEHEEKILEQPVKNKDLIK